MQIKNGNQLSQMRNMSPFPWRVRPFTEVLTADKEVKIPHGASVPDIIRTLYPSARPVGFRANYGFLTRDNKDRDYEPRKEDPFVMKDWSSVNDFKTEAHALIKLLADIAKDLDLPLKEDPDRGIIVVDSEAIIAKAEQLHAAGKTKEAEKFFTGATNFIVSNTDIMKKACLLRGISVGWWCVSYAGKTSAEPKRFVPAMKAMMTYFSELSKTDEFWSRYNTYWDENSDPIDTNPGYPSFSASQSKDGQPVARSETVDLFEGFGFNGKLNIRDWPSLLEAVDAKAGHLCVPGFPLAVAPLRRIQGNYKWAHVCDVTLSGTYARCDVRGLPTQRVAWMVPYVYNIFISPFAILLKTLRSYLPGCIHTGDVKRACFASLQARAKQGQLFLAEADYSNYDRFIPVDLIEAVVHGVNDVFKGNRYWADATMHLHKGASLLWPDYSDVDQGHGWAFKPGVIGLLSGVKITSETGTFINCIVNLTLLAEVHGWNESQMVQYLRRGIRQDSSYDGIEFTVQSDDTALFARTLPELITKMSKFMELVKAAGLKGSVEAGDRFLMRTLQGGSDRPVAARVWQNTLSNETSPPDELVLLAGLLARTDGILGAKAVDPFGTGSHQHISLAEARFSRAMLISLRKFFSKAAVVSTLAIKYLDILIDASSNIEAQYEEKGPSALWQMSSAALGDLRAFRDELNTIIVDAQRHQLSKLKSLEKWLIELYRDRFIPSADMTLQLLLSSNPELKSILDAAVGMERAYFKKSASTIGVKPFTRT